MRCFLYILLLFLAAPCAIGQQILLLTEDFETPNSVFAFDTGGLGGTTGPNRWIINDEFDGMGVYPNTTNQDSTVTGTITDAPFSTYLHIHDENATSGIANANFDPTASSDRFVYTDKGFCTLGMVDVVLAFFYLSEGNVDAWGEIYYSIDGGPWTQVGNPKYSNQSKWKYVTISEPAFEDVANLRFGFRWVNGAGSPPNSLSFALDDIIVVGTYDEVNNPTDIIIDQVIPDPVCQLNFITIAFHLTNANGLCHGDYQVELYNPHNSQSRWISLGVFSLATLQSSSAIAAQLPPGLAPDGCYKIRISRLSPPPVINGTASACFEIQACPNIINTMPAVVTTDPDTVCALSAIDIPFTSTGVYNNGNQYIAQLSDSNGNFVVYDTTISPPDTVITLADTSYIPIDTIYTPTDTTIIYDTTFTMADTTVTIDTIGTPIDVWQRIGSLPSSQTFDPAIGAMPGTVSGLIPTTPPGCNYYIRIVSTKPVAEGSLYGPFCIRQCDITTNETLDIHVCINETVGVDTPIQVEINTWDTLASYLSGNSFSVQLLNMMTLAVVNTGGLGVSFDTASHTMILSVPGLNTLLTMGILPGVYYMRVIADSSTHPWNMLGTIIRLTIGAPADNPSIVVSDKSVYCNSEIGRFTFFPYNQNSDYWWSSTSLNNGQPFQTDPSDVMLVNFTGASPGFITIRVREENYGCFGPLSPPLTDTIATIPNVNINGPPVVCQGDTFLYDVLFIPATYYEWEVNWGNIIDTSNNEIRIVFDSTGIANISLYALNTCGVRTSDYEVEVISVVDLDIGKDTTICVGEEVTLDAGDAAITQFLETDFNFDWTDNNTIIQGNMFDLKANRTTTITRFDGSFDTTRGPVDVEIYYKASTYVGFERDAAAWTLVGSATGIAPNAPATPTPIPIPVNVTIPAGETYAFYITTTNSTFATYTPGSNTGALFTSDGILEFYEGSGNVYPFGANSAPRIWNGNIHYLSEEGLSYLWNTGDTTKSITVAPNDTLQYSIRVSEINGCSNTDQKAVNVNALPLIDAGLNDTLICRGQSLPLAASGADVYTWSPEMGLSNTNTATPEASPTESVTYRVEGTDTITGCINYDDVIIEIDDCELMLTIPKAFTPNGDGKNDFFTVFGDNIDEYEIRIFNRWGEQVYYSNNVDELSQGDTNKGWDGRHKGELQNMGTYIYYIKVSSGNNPPVERKGNLTLIR